VRLERSAAVLGEIAPSDLTLTVGNFDGVHRGHREVFAELLRSATFRGTPAVVVTFEPHPLTVVGEEPAPGLLSPGREREELIEAEGVDLLLCLEFTPALSTLSAQAFLGLLSVGAGSHLVLGYDFRMGSERACDVGRMGAIGRSIGFGLDVIPPVTYEGRPISSSRLREEIAAGEVEAAAAMLGREYVVRGDIVDGAGRGRELGYPTLNVNPPARKLLPGDGVYLARVSGVGPTDRAGLLYVGKRPTLSDERPRSVEIHLPAGPPQGKGVPCAALLTRLRPDRQFESTDQLATAIGRDIEHARSLLREGPDAWRTISF